MRLLFLLLVLLLSFNAAATNYKVMVGTAPVLIKCIKGKGKTFVHLHQNEKTALKAAKSVIKKQGGSLITLQHAGGRNIVFHLHHRRYEFDPNRIFTDTGIRKTLKQNGHYSSAAHRQVKRLALKIRSILPPGKVIAVHNNAHYSLKDYMPGHELAQNAKAVHKSSNHQYRNFYLLTKLSDYKRLKKYGYNEILQKKSAIDDGSLSILLSKRNYINVEAGHDQLKEQIRMLQKA